MLVGIGIYFYFSATTTFYSKDGSFSITIPKRYQIKENKNSNDALLLDLYQEKENWIFYVSSLPLDRNIDLLQVVKKDQGNLSPHFENVSDLSEITSFPMPSGEALCYSYQYTSKSLNTQLYTTAVFIKTDSNKLYLVTISVPFEPEKQNMNSLLEIVKTFQEINS